ncbi:hypothetical protein HY637_03845 [Candidatus Woesearchaeota archaeon]|nr:hypothetical protein [Candidatus Woesearchaeota archaeon]
MYKKDLFQRVVEAVQSNPGATICYFRTFHQELVDIRYESHRNFRQALEELEKELTGKDDALFGIATGKGYNRGVQAFGYEEILYREDSDKAGGIAQRVEFRVAPVNGLYLPEELQAFMMSLVPGITPQFVQNFEYNVQDLSGKNDFDDTVQNLGYKDERLRLGKLGLYEKIGEVRRKIAEERIEIITDSSFRSLLSKEVVNGVRRTKKNKEQVKEYGRVITIEVFPNQKIAKTCRDANSPIDRGDYIHYRTLEKHQPGITQRAREKYEAK